MSISADKSYRVKRIDEMFGNFVDSRDLKKLESDFHERLSHLETQVRKPASESLEVARAAAVEAEESVAKTRGYESEVEQLMGQLRAYSNAAESAITELHRHVEMNRHENDRLTNEINNTRELYSVVFTKREEIERATQDVAANLEKIGTYLQFSEDLPASVEKAHLLLAETKKIEENINSLLTHSLRRKGEIDELYKMVYGEDIRDDAGNLEHIDGTKDELERSYLSISDALKSFDGDMKHIASEIRTKHDHLLTAQRSVFDGLVEDANNRFNSVSDQLTGLLPGAMAAGLSAAYEQKTQDEITSLKGFDANFRMGIMGMAAISAIPFIINLYLLVWKDRELVDLIKDVPSLVAAILPLYFPVLWLAYSSNKRANLSKRLIEEYTHKAVLGKTFSGLSHQIETLQHQGDVKEELRTRLLFNVLQVSAENPGKLITNYSKSDHPLMDALENSAKLADSISTLSKIPGFSSLAKKLSTKADELLKSQEKKVETGLDAQEALEPSAKDREESAANS